VFWEGERGFRRGGNGGWEWEDAHRSNQARFWWGFEMTPVGSVLLGYPRVYDFGTDEKKKGKVGQRQLGEGAVLLTSSDLLRDS